MTHKLKADQYEAICDVIDRVKTDDVGLDTDIYASTIAQIVRGNLPEQERYYAEATVAVTFYADADADHDALIEAAAEAVDADADVIEVTDVGPHPVSPQVCATCGNRTVTTHPDGSQTCGHCYVEAYKANR